MTSGNSSAFSIRKATDGDLDAIKRLADRHKTELGFILRPALAKAIADRELFVAEVPQGPIVGFVHYHHRRDQQTTLYHIVVNEAFRRLGVGQALVHALSKEAERRGKTVVLLKCPQNLSANHFYQKIGFTLSVVEEGKRRPLNVWTLSVSWAG